jgi:glycosyltransferase involved in cell wall biosynthesis
MLATEPLVSIGLPVYNGEQHVGDAARSVLDQDHRQLELVICDNASSDGTEEICRSLAAEDSRIRYHRHSRNIGLVNNFKSALALATGEYIKWIGDDDWLDTRFVSRCVEVLVDDPSLILVTTQQVHVDPSGRHESSFYDSAPLRSDRAVDRFIEVLRLINESRLLFDPLYGMMRRVEVARLRRPNMLYEDQVFAARLALAGPFGHIPEALSFRRSKPFDRLPAIARRLDVPRWHAWMATTLQCRELRRAVREADLSPSERRQASAAIARMFLRRQRVTAAHRTRKLAVLARHALTRRHGLAPATPERR